MVRTKRSQKDSEAGKSGVLPAKWEEVRAAGAAGDRRKAPLAHWKWKLHKAGLW